MARSGRLGTTVYRISGSVFGYSEPITGRITRKLRKQNYFVSCGQPWAFPDMRFHASFSVLPGNPTFFSIRDHCEPLWAVSWPGAEATSRFHSQGCELVLRFFWTTSPALSLVLHQFMSCVKSLMLKHSRVASVFLMELWLI